MSPLAWMTRFISVAVIALCLAEIAAFMAVGLPFRASFPLLLALAGTVTFLAAGRRISRQKPRPVIAPARPRITRRRCAHPEPVPVDLSTGERVAWLCPACSLQLPADFTPPAFDPPQEDPPQPVRVAGKVNATRYVDPRVARIHAITAGSDAAIAALNARWLREPPPS